MRVVLQRSGASKVLIDKKVVGKIDRVLVLLVSFTEGDSSKEIDWMVNKILNLRVFDDENGVMNKSVLDVGGKVLSISQFTLYGDCSKGNRPSYIKALKGELSEPLYNEFNNKLSQKIHVETGRFGSYMDVQIENDGPTTIILEK